jgi:autotransporter-associated beta strand protein
LVSTARKCARGGLGLRLLALVCAAVCALPAASHAATINGTGWKGTVNSLWSNSGNWDSTPPGSDERNLFFGSGYAAAGGTGSLTAQNDLSWSGYHITFQDINGNSSGADDKSFTITGNGFTLFDFGSGTFPSIENDSFVLQTFNLTSGQTVSLQGNQTSGQQFGEIDPVNGNITFSAGTKIDLAAITQLRIYGGNTVTFNDVISSTGNSGNNSVAINGTGATVIFGAANTYAGDTFVNGGGSATAKLQFASGGSANSSAIRIGDTSGTAAAEVDLTPPAGGLSLSSVFNSRSGSSGTATIASQNTSSANTLSGHLALDKAMTITQSGSGTLNITQARNGTDTVSGTDIKGQTLTLTPASGGTISISGTIYNSTGSGTVAMNGAGNLTLSGANTYSGATSISQGKVTVSNASALGTGTATVGAATLEIANVSILSTANALTLNNGATLLGSGGTASKYSKSGSPTIGSSASVTLSTALSTERLEIGTGIQGGNSSSLITVNGPGTNLISSGSTASGAYAGSWKLTGGTLQLTDVNALGNPSSGGTRPIELNGGTLQTRVTAGGAFSTATTVSGATTIQPGRGSSGAGVTDSFGTLSIGAFQLTVSPGENLSASSTAEASFGATTLTGNATFDVENGGSVNGLVTLSGIVSDSPAGKTLTKTGSGTLTVSGANTYAGDTTVSAGTLKLGAAGVIPDGSGKGNVSITGTLDLSTFSETINGLSGAGTVDTVAGGTPTLTAGNNDQSSTFSGIIKNTAGTLALAKTGAGTLTLSGNNTYSGKTTIQNGTVSVSSLNKVSGGSASSGLGAPTTSANGTISLGATTTAGTLLYTGTGETTDRVLDLAGTTGGATLDQSGTGLLKFTSANTASGLGAKTLTLQGSTAGVGEIAGALVDSSSGRTAVAKTGSGTWTLSGANSYQGGITLSAGQLNINSSTALGYGFGIGFFTISGGAIDNTSAGAVTLVNNNPQNWNADFTFIGTKDLNLGGGAVTPNANRIITVNGGTLEVGGAIGGGAVSLTKMGAGALSLSGSSSTFSGGVMLSAGQLNINSSTALGATAGAFTINGGTIDNTSGGAVNLDNNNPQNWNVDFTFIGTKDLDLGKGAVTPSASRIITVNGGNLQVDGAIGGGGISLTKAGSGTLILGGLSGVNTYSGGTTIKAGAIALRSGASATRGALGPQTASVFLGDTSGSAAANLRNSFGGPWPYPLTVQSGSSGTKSLGDSFANITWSGSITLNDSLTVNGGADSQVIIDGNISGSGGITKVGTNNLAVNGEGLWLNGTNNTFSGGVNLMEGELDLNSTTATTTALGTGTLTIGAGTKLGCGSGHPVTVVNNNPQIWNGDFRFDSAADLNLGGGAVTLNATVQVTIGQFRHLTVGGVISGSGFGLTKAGLGILTLSGANTYSGNTTIAGTLQLGAAGVIPNGAAKGNVSVSGTLDLNTFSPTINGLSGAGMIDTVAGGTPTFTVGNNDQTSTFSGIITNTAGTLALTKTGAGTLTLSGANTYSGSTTISAGILALTGTGTINNTPSIIVSSGAGFDVSGRTGGSYSLTSGQTLKGNGGVKGTLVVVSGATVAPGTSIGTLYFTNAPTLSGTASMEIDRAASPNADKLVVVSGGGQLVYGGTLTVVNNGAALQGGDTLDLFDADSFSGSFSTMNLPALGTGLNWWTDRLTVDGTINVNRAPTAQDKTYTRSKGVSLKIAKADLVVGAGDADSGDSVSYDALTSTGTQGAAVTQDSTYIFYAPANDNNDTLQYRLKDTRGGAVTKNIQITVVNATGLAQSLSVSGGVATASFAGIPGYSYQIQRSTNLVDWVTLLTTNAPSGGLFQFTDDFNDLGGPPSSAYYRLRQP